MKLTKAQEKRFEKILNYEFMDFYDQKDHKIKEIYGFEQIFKQFLVFELLIQRKEIIKEFEYFRNQFITEDMNKMFDQAIKAIK